MEKLLPFLNEWTGDPVPATRGVTSNLPGMDDVKEALTEG